MFFVEVVYDAKQNKITEVRCFKEGHLLDKYSPNLKTEYWMVYRSFTAYNTIIVQILKYKIVNVLI